MKAIMSDLLREMLDDDEARAKLDVWLENCEPLAIEFRGRWYFVQRMKIPPKNKGMIDYCGFEKH